MTKVLGYAVGDPALGRFALTDADAVWCARMLIGEEGESASLAAYRDVVSCMLQRLVIVGGKPNGARPTWATFTELCRAYSQPINPAWATRGDPTRVARRARITNMAWEDIPATARKVALDTLSGRMSLTVPTAVHFAAPYVVNGKLNGAEATRAGWQVVPSTAANLFVSTTQSRRAHPVRVDPADGNPGGKLLAAACVVALVAAAAGGAS